MAEIELKPCPFCGGAPYGIKYEYDLEDLGKAYKYMVLCTRCFARSGRYSSEDVATEAWNKREGERNE